MILITYFREILYLLDEDRKKIPFLLFLFLVSSLLDLASLGLIGPYVGMVVDPNYMSEAVMFVINSIGVSVEQNNLLKILGIALIGTFMIKTIVAIGVNYMIVSFSQQQQVRLRTFLMQSYQSLPYTEYLCRNSSEYIFSIQGLTSQFSGTVVMVLLKLISEGIVTLMILVFLAITNGPALLLLISMLAIVVLSYDRIFQKKLKIYGAKSNLANTSVLQAIQEGMEGLKEIRILGKEIYFYLKVREGSEQSAIYGIRQAIIALMPRYLMELVIVLFVVLLVMSMLSFQLDLKLLLPTLGIFGVASLRLLPASNMLISSFVQMRFARNSVSRLFQDIKNLKYQDSKKQNISSHYCEDPFESLKIDNISFRYPNAKTKAINRVSFEIHSGESIGIIGSSGSGKTTLIDVLLALLKPQEGGILYNNEPLSEKENNWRSQVAYLPQQVFLIDNSLKHNVALGDDESSVNEKRLTAALKQARLFELVAQLPQGVDTLLGERGIRLSGGQRQRVALARAFYHGRNVLVMDEATSALDNETEREIVNEIERLKGEVTMIVIAHRLTTLQHCDKIYELKDGQIVNSGTYNQIVSNKT